MVEYLQDLDLDTIERFVPLVYDYNCDDKEVGCKKQFRSFMSHRSLDISSHVDKFIDHENFLNHDATI